MVDGETAGGLNRGGRKDTCKPYPGHIPDMRRSQVQSAVPVRVPDFRFPSTSFAGSGGCGFLLAQLRCSAEAAQPSAPLLLRSSVVPITRSIDRSLYPLSSPIASGSPLPPLSLTPSPLCSAILTRQRTLTHSGYSLVPHTSLTPPRQRHTRGRSHPSSSSAPRSLTPPSGSLLTPFKHVIPASQQGQLLSAAFPPPTSKRTHHLPDSLCH